MAPRGLIGTATTIAQTWYTPGTETLVDADAGVTYGVVHVNGTVIVASGTAAAHGTLGIYTGTIPAQTNPADMVITWTGTFSGSVRTVVDYISIVGAFFADLAEIRALDGISGQQTLYPTATLINNREAAELLFEQVCGVSWTPKYAREVLDGDPTYRRANMPVDQITYLIVQRRLALVNRLPRTLLAVYIDAGDGLGLVSQDITTFKLYPGGEIERLLTSPGWPRGVENIVLEYTYGNDRPPADLKRAYLKYIRYLTLDATNRVSDRATSMTTDTGTYSITQAVDWQKPTGLPEVDAVLRRYGERIPIIA